MISEPGQRQPELAVGLFVGGRGLRMGGLPKGHLEVSSGQSVIERLIGEVRAAWPDAPLYLIGEASAYGELCLPNLADDPPGVGPMGGLMALLSEGSKLGLAHVIAIACDLPYVSRALLARLGREAPNAGALAAQQDDYWQPLCARYSVGLESHVRAMLASRRHSLQALFARLHADAVELHLTPSERAELKDWDCPEDLE